MLILHVRVTKIYVIIIYRTVGSYNTLSILISLFSRVVSILIRIRDFFLSFLLSISPKVLPHLIRTLLYIMGQVILDIQYQYDAKMCLSTHLEA